MLYYLFKCRYSTSDSSQHYFNMCLNEQQSLKFEEGRIKYQFYRRDQYCYADIEILNKQQVSKQTHDELASLINNEYIYSKLYKFGSDVNTVTKIEII